MADPQSDRIALDRILFLAIGALAGLAAYLLIEVLSDHLENDRLLLLIAAVTGGFFACLLAAAGPLRFGAAARAAVLAALPAALVLYWASFRFAGVKDYLETVHPVAAFVVIVSIILPFVIAGYRAGEGWRHYPALFTQAWNIVVRYAAAWVFTAVFWGAVALSDALFGLVGLDIIERLIEIEWVPFVVTGAVLGLAMAVVVELSDYLSPFLILRLLRLLVPFFLVVTVVFLGALPVQGLSDLFGGLSAAATLMAMVFGSATLITSALDRTDEDAATARSMRGATQLLALVLPALAGLAIYAIWLRVAEYGWSPDRLAAAATALVSMGYAATYAVAVMLRRDWMRRIRAANIAVALGAVVIAVLWLTPVFNAQHISARDQVARLRDGAVSVERLDLWFIGNDLGRAGAAAIKELRELAAEDETLAGRLDKLANSSSRYAFEGVDERPEYPQMRAALREKLVIRPADAALPGGFLEGLTQSRLRDIAAGCELSTPAGNPGCVLVRADFIAAKEGQEALLFYATSADRAALRVMAAGGREVSRSLPVFLRGQRMLDVTTGLIDALIAGQFELGPVQVTALSVGGVQIILEP